MVVGAAYALVDHVGEADLRFEPYIHADLEKDIHDAGVLAERAMAFGAHARIGEDLRNRILGGQGLLALIGATEGLDVVLRVVVADVLQGVGDALD